MRRGRWDGGKEGAGAYNRAEKIDRKNRTLAYFCRVNKVSVR